MIRSLLWRALSPSHRKIRLRHILQLGIQMEEQAEAFYRRFAGEAQDADVRALCSKLASEEIKHRRLIEGILSRWKSLPLSRQDLEALDAYGGLRDLFLSPPGTQANREAILDYAINEEEKMIAFYEGFEKEFNSAWKLLKLQRMVAEEKGHVMSLSDMLSKR